MKQVKRVGLILVAVSMLGVCFAGPTNGSVDPVGNLTAPVGVAK